MKGTTFFPQKYDGSSNNIFKEKSGYNMSLLCNNIKESIKNTCIYKKETVYQLRYTFLIIYSYPLKKNRVEVNIRMKY